MDHNEPEQLPTAELVALARNGDRAAFYRLARHYRPVLLALTFLRTRSLTDSDDLVQEILLRVWQKLPRLRRAELFVPWMRMIAANVCSTWSHRRAPAPLALDVDPACLRLTDSGPLPLEAVLANERQRALHRALLLLPPANRLALLMYVWGDYSYAEIAAFAEVAVTTVEGRIYRAKRQMQRLLRGGAALVEMIPPVDALKKETDDDELTDN